MALSLDGQIVGSNTATSITASLTTTLPSGVVVAIVDRWNSTSTEAVTGVTCGGVAMTKRSGRVDTVGIFSAFLEHSVWYLTGVAAGTYSIVASFNSSNVNCISAFGVHGADQTTPWDVNGALPALAGVGSGSSVTTHNVTYSTTKADTFIIASLTGILGGYYFTTPDSGFTAINGINAGGGGYVNTTIEYKVVSAAQSSVTVNLGNGGATNDWIGMVDALQAASTAITGDLIVTEAYDTFASTGYPGTPDIGNLAVTDPQDTFAAGVNVIGNLAVNELRDTFAASVTVVGNLATSDAIDVFSGFANPIRVQRRRIVIVN